MNEIQFSAPDPAFQDDSHQDDKLNYAELVMDSPFQVIDLHFTKSFLKTVTYLQSILFVKKEKTSKNFFYLESSKAVLINCRRLGK